MCFRGRRGGVVEIFRDVLGAFQGFYGVFQEGCTGFQKRFSNFQEVPEALPGVAGCSKNVAAPGGCRSVPGNFKEF